MKRWDNVVEGYLRSGEERGLSEETLRGVRHELDRWGCWLKRRRPRLKLEEVDGQVLIEYLRRRTHFHAKTTVVSVASKLRCLGEYLVGQGIWGQNPMRWVRGPRLDRRGKMPRRIGGEHIRKLWESAARQRGRYSQQLAVAMLSLLYATGLRRGELERLNLQDWNREENLLRVDGRKTGCERSVPVMEAVGRCLEVYLPLRQNLLARRGVEGQSALFVNREGRRMKAASVGILIHRLARRVQVPLVSVHQFRHTCASDLLESGASLVEVQGLLGHKSVATTTRYLHIADPQRAAAMSRHPLNDYLKGLITPEGRSR